MKIKEVVCLSVDHRYNEQNINRISEEVNRYIGTAPSFYLVGDGELFPRKSYDRLNTHPSGWWQSGPYRHLTRSYNAFMSFQDIISGAKHDNILILEDDAEFVHSVKEKLDMVPQDWDMVYLGANHSWSPTVKINENVLKVQGSLCWHAILLNKSSYQHILRMPALEPIDGQVAKHLHNKLNCYALWPNCVIQRPGMSYVEGKERDYREFFECKGNPCYE